MFSIVTGLDESFVNNIFSQVKRHILNHAFVTFINTTGGKIWLLYMLVWQACCINLLDLRSLFNYSIPPSAMKMS